jgi:hypothetical protein
MSLELDATTIAPAVEAELSYLAPTVERPRNYADDPPPGTPRSNISHNAHRVVIRDLRRAATPPSLDREGFEAAFHQSAVGNFLDDDEVRRIYYTEAEQLLKQATGADRVLVFDATVRRRVPGIEDRGDGPRQPALRVHVDHTQKSGPQRVRDLLPDEAEELLRGRVQIINIWRPLHGPLRDYPLAVADARSVSPDDLVASDLVYRHRVGETYSVTYNPAHRWFYLSEMRPDEVLLVKCYDSLKDGRARFAPHTAFVDPTAPPDARLRESIELRTLVFHRPV